MKQKPVRQLTDIELEAEIMVLQMRRRQFGDPWTEKEMQCFPEEYFRSLFSIVGPYNERA